MKDWSPRTLPGLVIALQVYDAWLVGSAADPKKLVTPKDFDVFVPRERWHEAAPLVVKPEGLIVLSATILGGWKVRYNDRYHGKVTVDVWPDDLGRVLLGFTRHAVHLRTKTLVSKR